jgi:DNA-binding transcriptional ArsR family regulator
MAQFATAQALIPDDRVGRALAGISHRTRFDLVIALGQESLTVAEAARRLGVSYSAARHHLNVLRRLHFVCVTDGRYSTRGKWDEIRERLERLQP